ncbi:MAG: riboflavin synthase [Planctomycetota bacterium]|jgi:riboflavin synthase
MFTGLIEAVCPVKSVVGKGGGLELGIDLGERSNESKVGDSVSINGVCLTVAGQAGQAVKFDVSAETLSRSTLGRLRAGSKVNVELAMKAGGRFGGHIVQGHVDGVARIKSIERKGRFADMRLAAGAEMLGQMVVKGSVAVDGISLTIVDLDEGGFGVTLVPETLERTTLGAAKVGDAVNIETDMIVKAVKRQLERILPSEGRLTVGRLKELGF